VPLLRSRRASHAPYPNLTAQGFLLTRTRLNTIRGGVRHDRRRRVPLYSHRARAIWASVNRPILRYVNRLILRYIDRLILPGYLYWVIPSSLDGSTDSIPSFLRNNGMHRSLFG
jgi:hypothetical protein